MQTNTTSTTATHIPAILSTEPERRIYVASIFDYNNGVLYGKWIDSQQDSDEIQDEINVILANSPTARRTGYIAEEWAIHAYDGFHGILIAECEDLETVSELAAALEEHGEIFAKFYDYSASSTTVQTCIEQFKNAYMGTYNTITKFAEQYAEEIGLLEQVPENLRYYFDLESWANDLEINGDIFTLDREIGIAVFGHY